MEQNSDLLAAFALRHRPEPWNSRAEYPARAPVELGAVGSRKRGDLCLDRLWEKLESSNLVRLERDVEPTDSAIIGPAPVSFRPSAS